MDTTFWRTAEETSRTYRSMRSSTQLIPDFWVRPPFVLDKLQLSCLGPLKFNALDIGGGGGAYLMPSLRCAVQEPCLSDSGRRHTQSGRTQTPQGMCVFVHHIRITSPTPC